MNDPEAKGMKMEKLPTTKSNKHIKICRDDEKSYVYIDDGDKTVGVLMWHYKKNKWVFEDAQ